MLIVHPVAIESATPGAAARRCWATWTLACALSAAFALERITAWSLSHHGLLSEPAARALSLASASARLYTQPELFAPWQPWSYALIHQGWWHLLANLAVLVVLGRALERRLGSVPLIATALAVAPITAAAAMLVGGEPGASGVICGWFALAYAREPRAQVRWGLSYYLVLVVGHLPLFRLPLGTLWLAFLVQEAARLAWSQQPAPWAWWAASAIAGAALGYASKRLQPDPP